MIEITFFSHLRVRLMLKKLGLTRNHQFFPFLICFVSSSHSLDNDFHMNTFLDLACGNRNYVSFSAVFQEN